MSRGGVHACTSGLHLGGGGGLLPTPPGTIEKITYMYIVMSGDNLARKQHEAGL